MEVDNGSFSGDTMTSASADAEAANQQGSFQSPDTAIIKAPQTLELNKTTPNQLRGARNSDVSPQDVGSDKKKKIRRKHKGGKHHRKWKPYSKMTWEERKVLEEKEGRRATRKREERFASGQAMAPYNTTQFLMDLHDPDSPYNGALEQPARRRRDSVVNSNNDGSNSIGTSDEYQASSDEEEIFLEREFSVDYENFHTEHIRSLSKDELVKEYLEMERKCESLEKRLRSESCTTSELRHSSVASALTSDDLAELSRLRTENEQLRKDNEQLRAENVQLVSRAAAAENKENNPELET